MGYNKEYENSRNEEELEFKRMLESLPADKRSVFEKPIKEKKEKKKKIIIFISLVIIMVIILCNKLHFQDMKEHTFAENVLIFISEILYPTQ